MQFSHLAVCFFAIRCFLRLKKKNSSFFPQIAAAKSSATAFHHQPAVPSQQPPQQQQQHVVGMPPPPTMQPASPPPPPSSAQVITQTGQVVQVNGGGGGGQSLAADKMANMMPVTKRSPRDYIFGKVIGEGSYSTVSTEKNCITYTNLNNTSIITMYPCLVYTIIYYYITILPLSTAVGIRYMYEYEFSYRAVVLASTRPPPIHNV